MNIASTNVAKSTAVAQPCLTLVPVEKKDVDETELIQFTLKVRAGSATNAPTYKRKVARFETGTPAEWISVLEALDEIFLQNSVATAQDRENVIRTILRGDSWTAFESSIQESRINVENMAEPLALTVDMVSTALKAVSQDVFPHRALVNQCNWMKRRMRKPANMSVRQFVASVTQMNGKLLRFPGATDSDLFEPPALLELLEFALPDSWRAKFDLAGYIPTNHDKIRLVMEGEAIERSLVLTKNASNKPKQATAQNGKNKKHFNSANKAITKSTGSAPASASSPSVKHQSPAKGNGGGGKNFSGNKIRKELYAISKNQDRVKVIDQYAAVLQKERKKAVTRNAAVKKAKAKRTKKDDTSSSSDNSDDEVSVHVMDAEEARHERHEFMKRRIRATMQRIKKRQVSYNFGPTGTGDNAQGTVDDGTTAGNDVPFEEEIAFHEQVNHSDDEGPAFADLF